MKASRAIPLALAAALLGLALPAQADRHHGGGRGGGWRGDIAHFPRHDLQHWRGGNWRHGWHDGHLGWWWVVAGAWYFYPQPIRPYPDPYRPPVVLVPAEPEVPPVATTQPVPQVWYYCESARAYYPYVASCPTGWKAVPATPPGVADVPPQR
ncbi:hypothetical protein B9N43_05805 [Denitratisoma sp. DHT3]|uniref:hypothetical protein n=1 Tax=Denitratisoma sp. DHT3 TaxID=1981880 RepID=UPI0011986814|nr:hypothetical protein [Denitratisoma sp. DHT3]QDX80799.1 hypothetical protein B9N43_05805 [Denitratisoma sp. DHT3]